jgi:hypothetical protein
MGLMSSVPEGWQPLSKPKRRQGADAFHLSPFARLARAHAFSAAGDALLTIALAGSLFFDIDPNDARWKIVLYLGLTMAPLALVAPFIGPALDRSHGGRRWMIIAVNAVRVVLCLVMLDDLDSLLLFPEAFTVLAMGKAYGVARSALVPTVVRNDGELVEANSKLQLLSGLAAPAAGILAAPAYGIARSQGVLAVAAVAYLCGTVAALRIPTTVVASAPVSEAEAAELRGAGIRLAASAMGLLRGVVGFLTMLLLFELREDKPQMAVVLVLTGAGSLIGSALAPRLRQSLTEERMLMALLGGLVVVALGAAWAAGLAAYALLAATVAIVSTGGRLSFDSIVQRDAPDANRGRSFARFEVRFQLVWVAGALLPLLLLPIPVRVGFVAIAVTAAFALFSYLAGQRAARRAHERAVAMDHDQADVGFAGDRTRPDAPAPTVIDVPLPDEGEDPESWQVGEPLWGGDDDTRVEDDPTNVRWWPRRR